MSDVRRKLRDDAGEDYELLKAALKEGLNADKPVQRKCEHCGRSNAFYIPDHSSRMKAVDTWISQGFGKPPNEEKVEEIDFDRIDVGKLSLDERSRLNASLSKRHPEIVAQIRKQMEAERSPAARPAVQRKKQTGDADSR